MVAAGAGTAWTRIAGTAVTGCTASTWRPSIRTRIRMPRRRWPRRPPAIGTTARVPTHTTHTSANVPKAGGRWCHRLPPHDPAPAQFLDEVAAGERRVQRPRLV